MLGSYGSMTSRGVRPTRRSHSSETPACGRTTLRSCATDWKVKLSGQRSGTGSTVSLTRSVRRSSRVRAVARNVFDASEDAVVRSVFVVEPNAERLYETLHQRSEAFRMLPKLERSN